MGLTRSIDSIAGLDAVIEQILRAARIPGAAIAVVANGATVIGKGYGYRDLTTRQPVTSATVYPIGSTTKAINATLLGLLVDEGRLTWDSPVQDYLPRFRLRDPIISAQVTVRDLLTMRTGLPRHDWVWIHNPLSPAEMVERLRYLESSAGFRERFQYNNLTVATAGHIAEAITGKTWEELVQQRLFGPLGMSSTGTKAPATDNVILSYHENSHRELVLTKPRTDGGIAPAGSAIHSTIEDMARWLAFNLNQGRLAECSLIESKTLAEIHSSYIAVGADPTAPAPGAAYAMGWFVDTYNGCARLSHGGYLRDVNSDVMLFPKEGIGFVSFTNFGPPIPARLINEHAFDLLMGFKTARTVEEQLSQYEKRIDGTRQRNSSVHRVPGTSPSHPLSDYAGRYAHPGYGRIEIERSHRDLVFRRNLLALPLQHWHYDAWIAKDNELFPIQIPHAFDPTSRLLFETNADGGIAAVSIRLEPAVDPIRFVKQ